MTSGQIATLLDCAIPLGIGIFLVLSRRRFVAGISDPGKRERTDRALRIAGPLVVVGSALTAFAQFLAYEGPAELAARQLNASGSTMVDSVTRFDRATAGPGQQVVIDETITTITSAQFPPDKWEAAVPELRKRIGASKAAKLSERGIKVVYRFYDKNGILIGEIALAPSALSKS